MKVTFNIITYFIVSLLPLQAYSASWKLAWEIKNLPNPESVVFDNNRETIYVSNQSYGGKPGSGSIGKLSLTGKIINKEWVKGLTEPKGIAIKGNSLFVSDITSLIEIDINAGKIIKKYKAEGSNFLNDVAIDSDGNVFVSDMFNSSIYKLDTKKNFKVWLASPMLENPNGLLIKNDNLLISAWGRFDNKKPLTAKKGHLIQVSLKTQKIIKLTSTALGNLDGIQNFSDNKLIISDWVSGNIFQSDKSYEFKKIIDLEQSTGDIAYIKDKNLLLIPMAKQEKVLAYKLER